MTDAPGSELQRAIRSIDRRFGLGPFPADERPVFILSAGWRSGSTLLQRIVASTGRILVWGEPYDLSRIIPRLADSLLPFDRHWPPDDFVYDGVAPSPDEWIANAYPHPRHLIAAQRALLLRLFRDPAAEAGFDRWGVKDVRLTGDHGRFLRRLFPGAVFLVIHRDPYDAYASYRAHLTESSRPDPWWWEWPDTAIDTASGFGRMWRILAGSLTESAPDLGAVVLAYEELARGEGLDRIEAALGLDVDPSVLETWVDFGDRARREAQSRSGVPPHEVADLRAAVDPVASELGYAGPLGSGQARQSVSRRAGRSRRRGADDARRRARPADRARVARLQTTLRRVRRRLRRVKADAGSQWEDIRTTSLMTGGAGQRTALGYFPPGIGSPYARVMYAQFHEHGLEPIALKGLAALADLPEGSVFNLHWTRAAPDDTTDPDVAAEGAQAILGPIRAFVARGGRFLWSMHEPLPHDADFPEVEIGLRTELADLATRIHALHPSTLDAARRRFPVDESKAFVVEHPLYTGYYPDFVGRTAARRSLGIPDDAYVLVAFGSIRKYKGTHRIVRALPEIRRETGRDVRLVVAGWTPDSRYARDLSDLVAGTEGAVMAHHGPPDEYVHVVFRAADLAVQPYREFHNSGVSFLSLTFDCPIVAPASPASRDLEASGMARLFDPASDDDLTRAVVGAVGEGFGAPMQPAPAFAFRHDPRRLSAEMAAHIRSMLDDQSR